MEMPLAQGSIGKIPYRIFLLSFAVIFFDGFDTQVISYVAPMLAKQWHLRPGAMGRVFSAGLLGLMIGTLILSPLSDRIGRKRVIIPATFAFALLSLVTALASSLPALAVVRFATGLALGPALTNAIALASDHSPTHRRGAITMIVASGVSLGSLASGLLAARIGPVWGWQAVFIIGGIAPLLLCLLLLAGLPRSVARSTGDLSAGNSFAPATVATAEADGGALGLSGVRGLFVPELRVATPLIWLAFGATLLMLYLIVNWIPTILTSVGFTASAAAATATFYHVGAVVGTFTLASLVDRLRPRTAVLIANAICILSLLAYSFTIRDAGAMTPLYLFAIGFGTVGGQIALISLCSILYPSYVRATGLGWGLGVGRIGSIAGPLLGGMLIAAGAHPATLLRTCVAAIAVCAAAVLAMRRTAAA